MIQPDKIPWLKLRIAGSHVITSSSCGLICDIVFTSSFFPWSYNQTWVKSDVGALTFWLESVRWYHRMRRGKSAEIGEPSYPSLVGSQRQVWPAIGLQPLKHNVWLRIDRCLLVFRIPRALPIFWNKANAKFLLGPSAAAKSASSVLNQSVGFNPVVEGLHGLTIPFWWYSNSSPLPCSLLCPIWTCQLLEDNSVSELFIGLPSAG